MKHMKIRKILSTLGSLAMCLAILCAMMLPVLADDGIPVEDEKPNTDIKVIPSDANALVLMDVGAESPKGVPGDVVTVVVPVAVNKEYLPSERYMLRNINVEPDIPSDTSVKNWPFDIINASYTRHLDDMSYNSTAEIYYDFRISEFATKGVYPVNFKINATVWRYDDVNGTSITEDVTFTLGVYVTVVGDGDLSGSQTSFGALQVASFDEVGEVQVPTAKPGDTVTFTVPVVNKGGRLSNITIAPVVSSNVEEFPFIAQNSNYGAYFNSWENGEVNYVEFTFKVSTYATNGNKPVTFRATYFENSSATECTFSSYIYITNGYEKPVASTTKPSAMSVMVEGYKIFVDDAEVSGLMAGDDVTLKITLKNNAKFDTSYKNVATISLVNSNALVLSVGSSDTDYVSVIKAGETAEGEYRLESPDMATDILLRETETGLELRYDTIDNMLVLLARSLDAWAKPAACTDTPLEAFQGVWSAQYARSGSTLTSLGTDENGAPLPFCTVSGTDITLYTITDEVDLTYPATLKDGVLSMSAQEKGQTLIVELFQTEEGGMYATFSVNIVGMSNTLVLELSPAN